MIARALRDLKCMFDMLSTFHLMGCFCFFRCFRSSSLAQGAERVQLYLVSGHTVPFLPPSSHAPSTLLLPHSSHLPLPPSSGVHCEGPFINKMKKGAHHENLIQSNLSPQVLQQCYGNLDNVRIVTLAPELKVSILTFFPSVPPSPSSPLPSLSSPSPLPLPSPPHTHCSFTHTHGSLQYSLTQWGGKEG